MNRKTRHVCTCGKVGFGQDGEIMADDGEILDTYSYAPSGWVNGFYGEYYCSDTCKEKAGKEFQEISQMLGV